MKTSKLTSRLDLSKTWARVASGILLAAMSAVFLILAFPPYNVWFFAWIAFLPMILAQHRVMPKGFSSLAAAIAIGGWGWGVFGPIFASMGTYMQYLPIVIFVVTLLFMVPLRWLHESTGYRWFVLEGIASWVGAEMIRGFLPIAGTWGFIAYTQHTQPWLIQPVSLFSIYGLSMLILLFNYALGLALLVVFDRRWTNDFSVDMNLVTRGLWATGTILVAWTVLSLILFRPLNTETLRVAAIQPQVTNLHSQSGKRQIAKSHARMLEQSREAVAQGAKVIVWPEGTLRFDPQVDDRLDLKNFTAETGVYLVLGYLVYLKDGSFRNEATVLSPEGEFLGVFGKDHPVTFDGETSPTRGAYPVYNTPTGKLATIICYDLDFTDTTRKMSRQDAVLIAVPSHDWPSIARTHYAHLVFRAVENRVAMIKADGDYASAIIDPQGRVLALSANPVSHEATLVTDVPLGTANTLTVLLGDWIGWPNLLGMGFFALLTAWMGIRKPLYAKQ